MKRPWMSEQPITTSDRMVRLFKTIEPPIEQEKGSRRGRLCYGEMKNGRVKSRKKQKEKEKKLAKRERRRRRKLQKWIQSDALYTAYDALCRPDCYTTSEMVLELERLIDQHSERKPSLDVLKEENSLEESRPQLEKFESFTVSQTTDYSKGKTTNRQKEPYQQEKTVATECEGTLDIKRSTTPFQFFVSIDSFCHRPRQGDFETERYVFKDESSQQFDPYTKMFTQMQDLEEAPYGQLVASHVTTLLHRGSKLGQGSKRQLVEASVRPVHPPEPKSYPFYGVRVPVLLGEYAIEFGLTQVIDDDVREVTDIDYDVIVKETDFVPTAYHRLERGEVTRGILFLSGELKRTFYLSGDSLRLKSGSNAFCEKLVVAIDLQLFQHQTR
ncbi:hypothetical protein N781_16950 [Pontibacillus halophilus JSM 076056 = DSM 19796]|uniref:DUF7852 domain-containing protein n=1 Tax=Pontibacillus halophilus JSM 076056 = DSM 19796 TaxID=1385510 RepID=A0A0A5I9M7_9BACI|nr:hypothetical protein [Pontibacillus halophilus]KGX92512.1 hypothetical protein N781_16950 [Pontibacillus halophilus JSM 076056 = DSM 19796]